MAYSTLVAGTTMTAAWANANVRDQVVTPFASAAARASAITAPVEGMVSYLTDSDQLSWWDGTAWRTKFGVRARRVATQLIATSTTTDIQFDTEDFDPAAFFTAPSTTFTVPTGFGSSYLIGGRISAAANTGTTCWADLKVNSVVLQRFPANANNAPPFPSSLLMLAAGDTVGIAVHQTSGVSVNFTAEIEMYRIG